MASISDISNSSLRAYRSPALRMRDLLLQTAHLTTSVESGCEFLATWMKGHGLPAIDASQEPVVWVFRGLAALDECERPEVRQSLVRWTAELLERIATDSRGTGVSESSATASLDGLHHDRLVYNLFRLCAGLAEPDALAAPIRRIFEQGSLSGDYQGIDHRSGLRAALVFNQLDASLQDTWLALVRQDADTNLPGRPYQGFEGLLWMPDAARGRGYLALEPVVEALGHEIERLSDKLKRRDKLRVWFEAVARIHADATREIGVALIKASRDHEWPRWAVESMPLGARLQSLVAAG